MSVIETDVAVIGAGSAGLNAFRAVEKAGRRGLLIESGEYGTTCARVGCMPSKLLVAAADAAHCIPESERFGIVPGDQWSIDGAKVMQRVRHERDRFVGFVVRDTEAIPEKQRIRGHARFLGPNSLDIEGRTRVDASSIVIATGSSPVIPPAFDTFEGHVLVNDDVFDWTALPESVAVVGTGIIGLELGQALGRLGVRVAFFSPFDLVGPASDPVINARVAEIFGRELELNINTTIDDVQRDDDGWQLSYRGPDGKLTTTGFEHVLVTAGRRPNIDGLDLDAAGVEFDERGRLAWDAFTTQIGDSPIFLAGDVSGHRPLLHEAADEGRIAGENAVLYPAIERHERRVPLAIQFTDPQVAMVGARYADLDLDEIEVGETSFDDQGRARVMGKSAGAVRIYGDRKECTIIGAEMIGPRAEHLAHLLAWASQMRLPVTRSLEMPFYHPVIEEGLRTALRDLARKLKVTGECRSEDFASAPGE